MFVNKVQPPLPKFPRSNFLQLHLHYYKANLLKVYSNAESKFVKSTTKSWRQFEEVNFFKRKNFSQTGST